MNARASQDYKVELKRVEPLVHAHTPGLIKKPRWSSDLEEGLTPLYDILTCLDEVKIDPAQEVARIRQTAYRDGYQEGLQRARDKIEELSGKYQSSMAEMELVRDNILIETEAEIVELALLIAQEVLLSDTSVPREFTERMVEHGLGVLREADQITIHCAPMDVKAVKKKFPEFASDKTVVRVLEDPSIEVGGLRAECSLGTVDATVARRLNDVADQLRNQYVLNQEVR
ncbi:MAG: FliH/SctL family protein [Myxococcota bacterium]|nr:FliH/SctL family protein [Myxococcota bacterium]